MFKFKQTSVAVVTAIHGKFKAGDNYKFKVEATEERGTIESATIFSHAEALESLSANFDRDSTKEIQILTWSKHPTDERAMIFTYQMR